MPSLYVTEPGSRIEKEYDRIVVSKGGEVLLAVPLVHISEVILTRGVGVTTPALLSLLDHGTNLSLIHSSGRLRGRLVAAEAHNLPLRHKQYARSSDTAFCLEVSRAIVSGKLKNSRTLARRMLRSGRSTPTTSRQGLETHMQRLNKYLAKVPRAKNLAELRGIEGAGSKSYFAILRATLRQELTFEKRTRRPPKDPANALLSLAYTLLNNALFTACGVAGLDPYDGFFHADKYGRPALALDLVEEFRSVIADSVVLTVVNNRMLNPKDFKDVPGGGIYLTPRGLRVFVGQFGRRLNTKVHHPDAGRALTYQKVFELQARRLRKSIESSKPDYRPFLAK